MIGCRIIERNGPLYSEESLSDQEWRSTQTTPRVCQHGATWVNGFGDYNNNCMVCRSEADRCKHGKYRPCQICGLEQMGVKVDL